VLRVYAEALDRLRVRLNVYLVIIIIIIIIKGDTVKLLLNAGSRINAGSQINAWVF